MFMILNSRRLKAILLSAGVLFVGLGMYVGFQFQKAEANDSSISCVVKIDDMWAEDRDMTSSTLLRCDVVYMNCPSCPGYESRPHDGCQYEQEWDVEEFYRHRWPWSSNWSACHVHDTTLTLTVWETYNCGG